MHGGGANRTDQPRLGVILEYVASWLRPQENHVLAVDREVVRDAARSGCRSCSGTTSTRRSSATSTDGTRYECCSVSSTSPVRPSTGMSTLLVTITATTASTSAT